MLMVPKPRDEEWVAISIPWRYWNAEAYATVRRVKKLPGMSQPAGHLALAPGRHKPGGISWTPFDPQPPRA
ncbi:MAG: hypothetical protein AB7K09_06735 [Planctomycetota bacterium]